jgi:hypothetical protein
MPLLLPMQQLWQMHCALRPTTPREYTHKVQDHNHRQPKHRPSSACAQLLLLTLFNSLLTNQWQLHKKNWLKIAVTGTGSPLRSPQHSGEDESYVVKPGETAAAHQPPWDTRGVAHSQAMGAGRHQLTPLTAAGATLVRCSSTNPPTCKNLATATRYVCRLQGCSVYCMSLSYHCCCGARRKSPDLCKTGRHSCRGNRGCRHNCGQTPAIAITAVLLPACTRAPTAAAAPHTLPRPTTTTLESTTLHQPLSTQPIATRRAACTAAHTCRVLFS